VSAGYLDDFGQREQSSAAGSPGELNDYFFGDATAGAAFVVGTASKACTRCRRTIFRF
jgi:hypothetical protein